MTLRSAAAKDRTKHLTLKCHYCGGRLGETGRRVCEGSADCECVFCEECLKQHFSGESQAESPDPLQSTWVCLVCRGLCKCAKCQAAVEKKASVGHKHRDSKSKSNSKSKSKSGANSDSDSESNEPMILVKRWRYMPFLRTETDFHGPKQYHKSHPKDMFSVSVSEPGDKAATTNASTNEQYKNKLRRRDSKRMQHGWAIDEVDLKDKKHRPSLDLFPGPDDDALPSSLQPPGIYSMQ
jgi:hypothetical protein